MNDAHTPLANLHFLVAHDDPSDCRALADMLRRLGATAIIEAPDGHVALRWLQEPGAGKVDVAVLDLALAGIDALELMRRLAEQRSPVRLVVVGGYTANVMLSVETLAQAYGIELLGTLVKPASDARLQALLDHYVAPVAPAVARQAPVFGPAEVAAGLLARQFVPFFQPKIALASGQVMGLEVFARWVHPDHGVLGADSFIGAFDHAESIGLLDWTMIEQALAQCRQFHAQGRPVTLSINLDPATLAHPAFIAQITACLHRHHMLPDYLTFELPESSVLVTDTAFLERLLRLRMLGCRLAIDDYGTGATNLQLLAQVPFSELKIDRSFVDGASKKRALGAVLSSCLALARSLDRMSVAVGVETRQDWDFLLELGCTYAQGFYIANPMAAADFPAWLEEWEQFF
jgi:EAL domain-containing protein (putative c-di-GMP-specific phosphodiesterase class I)/CheY-like chemotaxis protein